MRISLIAAMTPEHLIGSHNKLPWHLPEDLKFFKDTTAGHAVIMGRKTFDSVKKPLPHRRNIVVTRNPNPPEIAGVEWATNLHAALELVRHSPDTEAFIVGGAEIYRQALPLADRMYITIVSPPTPVHPKPGDALFPQWNPAEWKLTISTPRPHLVFQTFDRIRK